MIVLIILVMGLVSADQSIPPVKQGSCASLIQTCGNCTFVNVTGIHYPSPNSTVIYLNNLMTKNNNLYNFTFCDNNYLGQYVYDTLGNPDGVLTSQSVSYYVTTTGQTLDMSKATMYIAILVIAIIILGLCMAAGIFIPFNNKSDQMTGYIIAVNNLKYLKIFSWVASYVMFMLIMYMSYLISYSFLDMEFLSNLFRFVFYIFLYGLLPGFILLTYFLIANAIRDYKLGDMLSRGFRISR
jgi:hypothetical protein